MKTMIKKLLRTIILWAVPELNGVCIACQPVGILPAILARNIEQIAIDVLHRHSPDSQGR